MDHRRIALVGVLGTTMVGVAAAATLAPGPPPGGRGPLATALDLESGPALDRRRAAAVAAITTACMQAAGHRFEPWAEPAPTIPDAGLDPAAWAERWGFGISTATEPVPPAPIDPNLRRLAHLSQPQRARLIADLYGDSARTGCQPRANDTVYELRERVLAPLRADLTALAAKIEADPVFAKASAGWITCVRAGLPTQVRAPTRPGALEAVHEWFVQRAGAASSGADLGVIQADERRTATAIAHCDAVLHEARRRVAASYEAAFVARHRDRVERLASAIRRAEAAYPSNDP